MSFYAELIGKGLDLMGSLSNAKENEANQREFAQKGIRWRVADAKAAGLHPLAALGAAGASYSPTTVISDLGSAGQAIDRSIDATRTEDERRARQAAADLAASSDRTLSQQTVNLQQRLLAAQIENVDAQTAALNRQGQNPPFPSSGSAGVAGTGVMVPDKQLGPYRQVAPEIQAHRPGAPGMLAGPPAPSTRTISFGGKTWVIPNVDLDSLAEEPLAAAAAIGMLNPGAERGMTRSLVQSLGRATVGGLQGLGDVARDAFDEAVGVHWRRWKKSWEKTPHQRYMDEKYRHRVSPRRSWE